jgi:hypothetical protein
VTSTTSGRFRVLASPRDEDAWTFVSIPADPTAAAEDAYELTDVPKSGHGELDDRVAGLRPGYVVEATLSWANSDPTVEELRVESRTLYEFVDEVTNLFEAAQNAWQEARIQGDAMNSQVTRTTDGEVNGVLYVFGEGRGASSLFDEFASGRRPLEPLVDRVNENEAPGDREVFVLRPAGSEFVVVYIALTKEGLLAETMRDTYDCPAPDEPLS